MAVVKLDMISVSGAERDFADTILRCIAEPEFHMDNAGELLAAHPSHGLTTQSANRFAPMLTRLSSLAKEAGAVLTDSVPDSLPGSDEAEAEFLAKVDKKLSGFETELAALSAERSKLTEDLREDEQILGQLTHLKNANVDLDKVFDCEFFRFRFGHMPRESYDNLSSYTADIEDMFFYASSVEKREVWGLYVTPHTKAARIDALFESLHFERVRISERAHGTPESAIEAMNADMTSARARLDEVNSSIKALAKRLSDECAADNSVLTRLDRAYELRRKAVITRDGFTLAGYVTKSRAEGFKAELEKSPSVKCTLEAAKTRGGIMPPTKLKNPGFLGGFQDFVTMYGLPSYDELDPTPIVALTYFLFFGMMFGDVGQGAVIILVGALMWFLKKMSLGKVLMCVGVSSIGFGFFYGSVFGMEDLIHGFNPNENINTVLFAAVGIGVVMIIAVMAVNIINGIRQKNIEKIFFSQNGLPGLLMYVGAVVLVLMMLGYVKFAMPTGVLVGLIVVMLLILFLREPLTKLCEGRADVVPESKLDFALENFFELFEVVLSYLTNTISFIRIGAFALSHVGMMSVVFLLAQTANGYNPVILVIGNLFVIGFEGMIVCIQVLRLEFYELFGRFFEGNGRPFEPAGSKNRND